MQAIGVEETPLIGGFELEARSGTRKGGVYPLAVLEVRRGETVRMAMTIRNELGAAVTRDLLAAYGRFDPATGTFTMDFGCVRATVSIPIGTTTHNVDCVAGVIGVGFDALAALGRHAPPRFEAEETLLKRTQLTVRGIPITGFVLSRV